MVVVVTGRLRADSLPPWTGWLVAGAVMLIWAAAPSSGLGPTSLQAFADQSLFLRAVEDLLATGRSSLADDGTVGPGFLAVVTSVRRVLSVDAGAALIVTTRLAFVVIVASVLAACWSRTARRLHLPVLLATGVALLATPWWLYSDIPWTHPVAAALVLVAVLCVRLRNVACGLPWAVLGAVAFVLLQTRSFEGLAVLLALLLTGLGFAFVGRRRADREPWRTWLVRALRPAVLTTVGAALGWAFVGLRTGYWRVFSQYAADGAAADLSLSPVGLPARWLQLFVDPCFRSTCSTNNYVPQGLALGDLTAYWQQPLLLQLPFTLASLYVLVVSAGYLLRRRVTVPPDVWIAVLAAGGLVLGYTANPIAGGAHLKYGFVRDFTAPAALLLYAAARTAVLALEQRASCPSPAADPGRRRAMTAALLTGAALALVPGYALPRLGAEVVDYVLVEGPNSCAADLRAGCMLEVDGVAPDEGRREVSDRLVLRYECGTSVLGVDLSSGRLPETVDEAREECDAAGEQLRVAFVPVELGLHQTPEGEQALSDHQLTTGPG